MFIQTEPTPNPNTLKFLPGRALAEDGAHDFASIEEAQASPLAEALFQVEGVERVYFGPDFVSVSKTDGGLSWSQMKAPILAAVMDHFTSGQPLFRDGAAGVSHAADAYEGEAAQIVAEIKDLLDTRIRPAVAQDGGDILFDRYEPDTGVVYLRMRGACSGCPSSSATLRAGVENTLRHYVPEVTRVEQTL
ncbi:NifU family protein [Caulobacter sp. 17J65-9]|uniref:NifU family protein n=1 Tax=Caulobacter sp. 17J65-9 TaxID=2709382 RepID=UPI0013CD9CBF|nr:NifU family protein [Caulobacter sp. 17J65-9]NEX91496.1 NifU family protein [Caulobacter sp. 17J65-9]